MNKELLHKDFVWNGISLNKKQDLKDFVAIHHQHGRVVAAGEIAAPTGK